ncbi:hypothetical protein AAVH_36405 [Aphelenchoides avenae]|nr:hypothetical protein AAVH_36405 [Aphelenchus avenae]
MSEVWSYCWRITGKDALVCKLCHSQVTASARNDGAVWRHMRQAHRDVYRRTRHYKHRAGVTNAQKILPMNNRPERLGSMLLLCDLQRKNWSDLGPFEGKHLDSLKIVCDEESGQNAEMDCDNHRGSNEEKRLAETFPQCTVVITELNSTFDVGEEEDIPDGELVVESSSLEEATVNIGIPTNGEEESAQQLLLKQCGAKEAEGHVRDAGDGRSKHKRKRLPLKKKRTNKHCEREDDADNLFFRMMRKNFKTMDKNVKNHAVAKLKEVLAGVNCV